MTETIFGKNLFDVYFEFLVLVPAANMEGAGQYLSQLPGGDRDVLASLLGSRHVVHL